MLWPANRERFLLRHVLGEQVKQTFLWVLQNISELFKAHLFGRQVSSNDFEGLEKIMKKGANEKQPFERLEVTKEELLRLFSVSQAQE